MKCHSIYLTPSVIENHTIEMQTTVPLWIAVSGITTTKENS